MERYNKIFFGILLGGFVLLGTLAFAAPVATTLRSILPELDSRYFLGTTTPSTIAWKGLIVDEICLAGDCQTTWSSGAGDITGGQTIGTGVNIFDKESSGILYFNTLSAGTNVTFSTSTDANTIVISSSGSGSSVKNPFDVTTIGGTPHQASSTNPFYFGKGLLAASTTLGYLNVGYIDATSTTATSTFAGGLTVNGTGFVVNQGVPANSFNVNANGNVGIGTVAPQALLSLAEGTTAAGGIQFGSDTYLYRDGTGQLTLAGNTSTTNHGVLAITNSDSNENGAIITGFNPTLNTGNAVGIVWGEDSSAYNSTYFQFVKVGDNSSSNRMDMGFSNVSNFLSITGLTNATFSGALTVQGAGNSQFTGNVGIGIDPVYPFAVSGVTYLSNGNGDNFLPYTDGNDYISAPNIIFRNSSNGEVARIITSTGSVGIG